MEIFSQTIISDPIFMFNQIWIEIGKFFCRPNGLFNQGTRWMVESYDLSSAMMFPHMLRIRPASYPYGLLNYLRLKLGIVL